MPHAEQMIAAIETYCRAETEKDRDTWLALFAEGIVHEDPVGVATRTGIEGVSQLWEMIVAGDVDLRLTDDVIVCGNEAIALMSCETGPADARRKTGPIVDHFTFDDDGKIVTLRAFYKYA
jgi:steroid delta-isomerase